MQEIRMWPFLAPRRSYQHMAVPRGATARAFAGERGVRMVCSASQACLLLPYRGVPLRTDYRSHAHLPEFTRREAQNRQMGAPTYCPSCPLESLQAGHEVCPSHDQRYAPRL